jgi:putative AlgH/UPF0301 family transcriptional regulator
MLRSTRHDIKEETTIIINRDNNRQIESTYRSIMFHHGGIKRQRRKQFIIIVLVLSFSLYFVQSFIIHQESSRRLSISSQQAVSLREIDDVEDIQEGTIVLSRVESRLGCHDLKQTYLHKAVVLIIDHDPDDFTQGIILNRASDLILHDRDIVYYEEGSDDTTTNVDDDNNNSLSSSSSTSWRIHFGGDIGGWYEETPQLLCLHAIKSDTALAVSDSIFDGVFITSHLGARSLVESGEAKSDDFFTFSGFVGWEQNQLQNEIDRGSWYLASLVDEDVDVEAAKDKGEEQHALMNLLGKYSWKNINYNPQSAGLEFWTRLMTDLKGDERSSSAAAKVGEDDVVQQQSFTDLMLKEWATQRLLVTKEIIATDDDKYEKKSEVEDADIFRAIKAAADPISVSPGNILKGSGSKYIINEQLFHKATILFLQDTPEASIGVVLNLPTKDTYTLLVRDYLTTDDVGKKSKTNKAFDFVVRYGGPSGSRDEGEQLIWLHDSDILKDKEIGSPISGQTSIHVCSEKEVEKAIRNNLVPPNQFFLVKGFCAWEKDAGSASGGVYGQLLNGNLEDTQIYAPSQRKKMWRILSSQRLLSSEESLRENFELALSAWEATKQQNDSSSKTKSRNIFDSNVDISTLADDALLAWMKIFLLYEAEYIL